MISTVTATTTAVAMTEVMTYSIIAVIALISFLALKEILSTESRKNEQMKSFVEGSNVAIVPLLMVFVSIVAYKVVTVI
jgi:predicted CDP-diglyceride synthetase/phosphatidate cytidylyltransferase